MSASAIQSVAACYLAAGGSHEERQSATVRAAVATGCVTAETVRAGIELARKRIGKGLTA